MGDHEMSDFVLGSKIAGPRGVCDGVVCSWRWGTSASGELDANEVLWEASCVCWINSSTQSASKALFEKYQAASRLSIKRVIATYTNVSLVVGNSSSSLLNRRHWFNQANVLY